MSFLVHAPHLRAIYNEHVAYRFGVIDLDYMPILRLDVMTGALLMMLGAFALCLVFGRNADPDANLEIDGIHLNVGHLRQLLRTSRSGESSDLD